MPVTEHEAHQTMDSSMMFDMDFTQMNPAFAQSLSFSGLQDDAAIFNDSLNFDPSPPEQLYSTPLSWDPPITQEPRPDFIQPVSRTSGTMLSLEQQEKLRSIAMPEHLRYQRAPELHDNSFELASANRKPRVEKKGSARSSASISSPEHDTSSRKRKCSSEAEDDEDVDDAEIAQPHKKTAHNMIEKRYRMNLNDKFNMLRDSVPSLRAMSQKEGKDTAGGKEDLHGLTPAHKKNKATVLEKATEYIKHLEKMYRKSQEENAFKDARIQAFEQLYYSSAMGIDPIPLATAYDSSQSSHMSPSNQTDHSISPRGIIEVPEDIRRMNAQTMQQNQQMYTSQDRFVSVPQHTTAGNSNGWVRSYFPKMMVGSLATILLLDGFEAAEQNGEEPAARGLYAFPVQVVQFISTFFRTQNSFNFMGYQTSTSQAFSNFKFMLLLSAIVYVCLPFFSTEASKVRPGKASTMPVAAPSLASSIQVRRQAWLTAIQTVWIPRHNFFLEVAALLIKMCKLSLRNLVGSPMYSFLTGVTKEQEEGHIKAWSIALDAQLGGGDVEISKSRLTLTLLASGTLPDTPARLMLKALHIRVLLWEVASSGYGSYFMFQETAAKLARIQWNKARELERVMSQQQDSIDANHEPLPTHLVSLLQRECDNVLNDTIIQRAHNLAWNKPSAYNAQHDSSTMDEVTTDFAIRSPLDAVSAWYSTLTLQSALFESLLATPNITTMTSKLSHAIITAPSGSSAHARALVARALLIPLGRGASIAAAMHDIQAGSQESNTITEKPLLINCRLSPIIIPQLKFSLSCATAIARLSRPTSTTTTTSNPVASLAFLKNVRLPPLAQLSTLSFVAAYQLMRKVASDETRKLECSNMLERLAGQLRIWSGGVQGREKGLRGEALDDVTNVLLDVLRGSNGGWRDEGYGSEESLGEDELGC